MVQMQREERAGAMMNPISNCRTPVKVSTFITESYQIQTGH